MSSIPISKEGFQALEQELDRLKKERPHVIQACLLYTSPSPRD